MPAHGSAWKNSVRDSTGETWAPGDQVIFKDDLLQAQERSISMLEMKHKWIHKEILTKLKLTPVSTRRGDPRKGLCLLIFRADE